VACLCLCAAGAASAAELAIVFGGGMSAGGRLFKVVSADSGDPFGGSYTTPDGRDFKAVEFDTELDESLSFSLRFRQLLRPQWHLSFGLSATDMDITANHRTVSDNVQSLLYDQVFLFGADTSVEFDWIPRGSRPFVALGVGMVNLRFQEREQGDSLDQTRLALCAGGGFRWRRLEWLDLDIEARLLRVTPDFGAEEDRLTAAESFAAEDPVYFWQFNAAWVYAF
jgi:hypothetical protein